MVSLLTIIAPGLSFVAALIATCLNMWLPIILRQRVWTLVQIDIASAVAGIFESSLGAASWGLVLAAIYGWGYTEGALNPQM